MHLLKKYLSNKHINVYNIANYTHRRQEMRTNVVVDDHLMASALKASGLKTKKGAIEEGLKLLVQVQSQKAIKNFRGKLKWSGNLDEMRIDK
jgi:Arc/MetJ family transcription regulator